MKKSQRKQNNKLYGGHFYKKCKAYNTRKCDKEETRNIIREYYLY